MKHRFLSVVLALSLVMGYASAVRAEQNIIIKLDNNTVSMNAAPYVLGKTIMIPLRPVFEALGAEVSWDGETQTVLSTRGEDVTKVTIDSKEAVINEEKHTLDAAPTIKDGNTMVPLSMLEKAFNCNIARDETTDIVNITSALPEFKLSTEMPTQEQIDAYLDTVFANSTATSPILSEAELRENAACCKVISDDETDFYLTEDTYAQGGSSKSKINGGEYVIAYKNDPASVGTARKGFMKFDLSAYDKPSVASAVLEMTTSMVQDGLISQASLHEVDPESWSEDTLCWENMPKPNDKIVAQTTVHTAWMPVKFDLTDFVNSCLKSGKKKFSLCIQDLEGAKARTEFYGKDGMTPPVLKLSQSVSEERAQTKDYDPEYMQVKRNSKPAENVGKWVVSKVRTLDSLKDFIPSTEKPQLSKYGGDMSRKTEATGYFHTKKIGDRWWLVDPEGYLCLNIAMNQFAKASTPNERIGQQTVYGDDEAWANGATRLVKDELGFNSSGAWSSYDLLRAVDEPIAYTKLLYYATNYGNSIGATFTQAGHKGFEGGVLPIFDPGFESFCNAQAAAEAQKCGNDPYLVGYMTDNELPLLDGDIIDRYLKASADNSVYVYAREAAWRWLRLRHGEDATLADVTARDRVDFTEFVCDRYAQVVSGAIKRYDPNHMWLGTRLNGSSNISEGVLKAYGRYAGAISINLYSQWGVDPVMTELWAKLTDKPVFFTEWYVKGMDSGLGNTTGAGWIVNTQKDRGRYYEFFTLGCLEAKNVVGWHWFQYKDNDPNNPNAEPSNIDSNKGIINTDFKVYTELTDRMKMINYNAYRLIDYFDDVD